MANPADKRLSFRRAAELIYRTSTPSVEQVQRIGELVAKGEIAGDSRGTSAAAVAEFVSNLAVHRGRTTPASANAQRRGEQIHQVYQQSLKQYFLAVILRRRVRNASKAFQRAVLGGQIGLLLAVGVLIAWSFRAIFPPTNSEHAAALSWLEDNTDKFRVIKFHPPKYDDDGNARLWVEYHYTTPQGRGIDTRRVFTVAAGRVVSVDSDE